MKIWIDAQLSPDIAKWIVETFHIDAQSVREVGLLKAKDKVIFMAAKEAGAVILSKDADFFTLLERYGSPPQILWLTCGNTSNDHLKIILKSRLPLAVQMLKEGEPLIEIGDLQV